MKSFTIQSNDCEDTQEFSGGRIRRRERISRCYVVLLVSFVTIGQCFAFHIANPYTNRPFNRLHATMGAGEDVSSSAPSIESYDRKEFEMQVGRAMDTLRDDYPDILVKDLGMYPLLTPLLHAVSITNTTLTFV